MRTDKPYSYPDSIRLDMVEVCEFMSPLVKSPHPGIVVERFRRGRHKRGIKSDCGGLGLHSRSLNQTVLIWQINYEKVFFLIRSRF